MVTSVSATQNWLEKISCEVPQDEEKIVKNKYIQALKDPTNNCWTNFSYQLNLQPLATVQLVYLTLRNVFTDKCSNDDRLQIIASLLQLSQDQWLIIINQLNFIMPIGTRGHDVKWAMKILSEVKNTEHRELLVHVANRFFKYDTQTIERGYILQALAELSYSELEEIDKVDQQTRDEFFAKSVPVSLKNGARISSVYDPILNIHWEV